MIHLPLTVKQMVGEKLSQEEFQHRLEELNDSDLQAKQQPTEGSEGEGQLSEAKEEEKRQKAQASSRTVHGI
jgi:hypothetical protein